MSLPRFATHALRPLSFVIFVAALGLPSYARAQTTAAGPPQVPAGPRPEPAGLFKEPRFLLRGIDFVSRTAGDGSDRRNGMHLTMSTGLTGSGWISGGGGFRRWLLRDHAVFESTAAVSWRMYKLADARFEFTRLAHSRIAAGVEGRWQDSTQVTYYGIGPDSLTANRAEYGVSNGEIVGYGTLYPTRRVAVNGALGWITRPRLQAPHGTFERGYPYVPDVFPAEAAFAAATQPAFLHGELSVSSDTRDFRSHPASGGVYQAAYKTFTDQGTGHFTTHRVDVEGAQFLSLTPRLVLAVHAAFSGTETAPGHDVPVYLMPTLGGHTTLRGYGDFRFHDRQAVVVNVEPRFAIMTHVDAAVYYDAGNVASRVADLNLDRRSYGVALSMHSRRATFARVDLAHGREGWVVAFRMSDPFHLSKLRLRTAVLPAAR